MNPNDFKRVRLDELRNGDKFQSDTVGNVKEYKRLNDMLFGDVLVQNLNTDKTEIMQKEKFVYTLKSLTERDDI